MNRISFDAVINFYPEHNARAYGQLLSALQDTTTVVPFVGAGLSAFCGYPSWPNVLTRMCPNIRDQGKRETVLKQIRDGQLLYDELRRFVGPVKRDESWHPLLELGGAGA